jgi:hypothetical protein
MSCEAEPEDYVKFGALPLDCLDAHRDARQLRIPFLCSGKKKIGSQLTAAVCLVKKCQNLSSFGSSLTCALMLNDDSGSLQFRAGWLQFGQSLLLARSSSSGIPENHTLWNVWNLPNSTD